MNQDTKNSCVQAEVLVGVMRGSSGFSTDEGVGMSLTMFSLFLNQKTQLTEMSPHYKVASYTRKSQRVSLLV